METSSNDQHTHTQDTQSQCGKLDRKKKELAQNKPCDCGNEQNRSSKVTNYYPQSDGRRMTSPWPFAVFPSASAGPVCVVSVGFWFLLFFSRFSDDPFYRCRACQCTYAWAF